MHDPLIIIFCGSSSVGRAIALQAIGREFEPRLPLHETRKCWTILTASQALGIWFHKGPPSSNSEAGSRYSYNSIPNI